MTFYSFSLYLTHLKYFSFIGTENSLCNPKETFTRLHDLGDSYKGWYIKVKWCLYPHMSIFNKTTYTYVKMVNRWGKQLKIFKVAKHENCSCDNIVPAIRLFLQSNSPTGNDQYEAMRKVYITKLKVMDIGILLIYLQFNMFIIFITTYYSICTCLSYIPHDSFSFVALGEYI